MAGKGRKECERDSRSKEGAPRQRRDDPVQLNDGHWGTLRSWFLEKRRALSLDREGKGRNGLHEEGSQEGMSKWSLDVA